MCGVRLCSSVAVPHVAVDKCPCCAASLSVSLPSPLLPNSPVLQLSHGGMAAQPLRHRAPWHLVVKVTWTCLSRPYPSSANCRSSMARGGPRSDGCRFVMA